MLTHGIVLFTHLLVLHTWQASGGAAAVSVSITVPIEIELGTYSIRATQNGLSWCSQPVEVVSA